MTPGSDRRGLFVALAAAVVGAAIVLLAAGRVWGSHTFNDAGGGQHVVVRGHDVASSLPALATAAFVLAAGIVATRAWLRRVVGVLVVVVGASVVGVALTARGDVGATLAQHAFAAATTSVATPASAWPWVAATGGVLVALAGALTTVVGHRWPALGRRYDAPVVARADDETSMWAALDRGDDPTA